MSTCPSDEETTERRPSNSTSERPAPRARRLIAAMPAPPELSPAEVLEAFELPCTDGKVLTKSMMFAGASAPMSSGLSTDTGVGELKPSRTIREPVATTSSSGLLAGPSALGCAAAVHENSDSVPATPEAQTARIGVLNRSGFVGVPFCLPALAAQLAADMLPTNPDNTLSIAEAVAFNRKPDTTLISHVER